MTHTPGPWRVITNHLACSKQEYQEVIGNERGILRDCICTLMAWQWTGQKREDERRANARLIAAAPDLLEACEYALSVLAEIGEDLDDTKNTLSAAIVKARGEP